MKAQKLSLIGLTATFLISAALCIKTNNFDGCVVSAKGKCLQCYKRKVRHDGQGCEPLEAEDTSCLIYLYNEVRNVDSCLICKPGFAQQIKLTNSGPVTSCVQAKVPDCLIEVDNYHQDSICFACPNNTYSVVNKTTQISSCETVKNPVPHCLWGAVVQGDGLHKNDVGCARCAEGYTVDSFTRQCKPSVHQGCWTEYFGKCGSCDPFSGYFADTLMEIALNRALHLHHHQVVLRVWASNAPCRF